MEESGGDRGGEMGNSWKKVGAIEGEKWENQGRDRGREMGGEMGRPWKKWKERGKIGRSGKKVKEDRVRGESDQ